MEKKMFFENEKKSVEWVTTLTETQFQYLQDILNVHAWEKKGVEIEEHKNSVEDAIPATIKGVATRIKMGLWDFEEGYREPFDISDDALTELILNFGRLERTLEISGWVTRSFTETVVVPLDADTNELMEMSGFELNDYGFSEDEIDDDGLADDFDADPTEVVTRMVFDLPTPTTFDVVSELKEVA